MKATAALPTDDAVPALAEFEAMRSIVDLIAQSRDNELPVFEAILDHINALCGTDAAALAMATPDRKHLEFAARSGKVLEQLIPGAHLYPVHGSKQAVSIAFLSGDVVQISDFADTDLYREGDPIRRSLVDDQGVRSVLAIPLMTRGDAIGVIAIHRHSPGPYSDRIVALGKMFAAYAVIAIQNTQQFRKLQDRLARESATSEVLEVISQSRDDETPVFEAILDNACALCNAPLAGLILGTAEDSTQTLGAHKGMFASAIELFETGQMRMDADLSYAARSILERRLITFDDMGDSDLYAAGSPVVRSMVDDSNIRSVLFVPLLKNGMAIGNLTLFRREISPFDQSEISLVESFAAQAVIALENVRQFREVQERLTREAATSNVLNVISQSRDNIQPTFQCILENACRLCDSVHGSVWLVSSDGKWLDAIARNEDGAEKGADFDRRALDDTTSVVATCVREMRPYRSDDLQANKESTAPDHRNRVWMQQSGARSTLLVPLISQGRGIGVIAIYKRQVKPYTDDNLSLMESFAAQAVIAIENVRQFREIQTRLEREKASREILQVISASRTDPGPVFDVILRNASHLSGARFANLCIANEARSHWKLAAHFGDGLRHLTAGESETPLDVELVPAIAIRTAQITQIEDLADTDLYRNGDPGRVTMVEVEGMRTILCVPLLRDTVAIGCITLFRREVKAFTNDEIALVETLAAQAVIAIENVRQFNALETLNAELGDRVEEQVGEIERMGRLKRFLPPAVADTVVSSGSEEMLQSHRALLGILFCDIRGFTAFCESAEPEETIEVLQTYHEEMGKLIMAHGAGVDHRMGDGIMVLFNDPVPCDDPAGEAVRLSMAMRDRMAELCKGWKRLGHRLGFGVGVSLGYATVGMVGYEGRFDYTASGTAVNLAARLCDQAEDGEILLSPRAQVAVEDDFSTQPHAELTLKGIAAPVEVFRLIGPLA